MATMTARLYALASGLGMVERSNKDDPFHQLVYGITGKEHISELTAAEALAVQKELQERMRLKNRSQPLEAKRSDAEPAAGMMTKAQQDKAWRQIYILCELEPTAAKPVERLIGAIGKVLGITVSSRDPFRWISFDDGARLIEQLKRYVKTAEKRAARRSESNEY